MKHPKLLSPEAFTAFYSVEPGTGCWLWLKEPGYLQYPAIWGEGRQWRAHRYAWRVHRGEIPAGVMLCHTCDNKRCVNPLHLFPGNHAANHLDYVMKHGHKNKGKPGQGDTHADRREHLQGEGEPTHSRRGTSKHGV